jgi:hypothetical protein
MTQNRTPTLKAYDRVIDRVKEIYKAEHGRSIGALTWFATELGITKQTVDNWGKRVGIPQRYVGDVAGLTGLKPLQVRPDTVFAELPSDVWTEIQKRTPEYLLSQITIHPVERIRRK